MQLSSPLPKSVLEFPTCRYVFYKFFEGVPGRSFIWQATIDRCLEHALQCCSGIYTGMGVGWCCAYNVMHVQHTNMVGQLGGDGKTLVRVLYWIFLR